VTTDRDRDVDGRARNARPRDALGRPLPYGTEGEERAPEGIPRSPAESLAEAQALLDAARPFYAHEELAVGLTHAMRGNARGAASLLDRGADNLQPYAAAPPHAIDVGSLVAWGRALAAAAGSGRDLDLRPPRLTCG
jgi:hypothetical protein